MRKLALLIVFLLISYEAFSETIRSSIHSIVRSDGNAPHILRLINGRAAYIDARRTDSAGALANNIGREIEVEIDKENFLLSFKLLRPAAPKPVSLPESTTSAEPNFAPTPLKDLAAVKEMFQRLNPDYQRVSECYNRAHVWAYEEFKNYNIKSEKAWIFFTNSYLRRTNFSWWFHVAPLVRTLNNEEYVLDYRFTFGPATLKEWTDLWVYSKRSCPVVGKYSEYSNHQEEEDCYVMKTSMYFWQPWHVEFLEKEGINRTEFSQDDLKWSYQEAF